ncbi:MAG: hypothetical protein EBT75_00265 [Proteobacteria bacterium]|nr:hypothetical protein [Pseudomonadota bacterium]
MTTFTVQFQYNEFGPLGFYAESQKFATKDQAEAFLATLPKSLRAFVREYAPAVSFTVMLRVPYFHQRAQSGPRNETGLKRAKRLLTDPRFNIEMVQTPYSYGTVEEALAAIEKELAL